MGDWIQMGRIKKKNREISFSLFYLKYFLYLFISMSLIAAFVLFAVTVLFSGNVIYPADYAQEQAELAYDKILDADEISVELIPEFSRYILFDLDGGVKAGNIEENGVKRAWAAVQGSRSDFFGNYYKVIPRENEYCVLRYKIIPQYKSAFLQKYFLSPQTTILIGALILIFLSLAGVAIRFGHILRKKLNPLILATEKIQNQELEFSIETDNIKELNTVLVSMDKMRIALKNSLESQWKMERLRKEQISALAHDLKTPLTLIRGNAELLYDTNPTKEQSECIRYIEASSQQIQNYVQMLIVVMNSNDGLQAQMSDTGIADFLQNINKQAKGLCMVKNIELKWKCSYQTYQISMDYGLLERAFNNVMSNAVEHTPSGGTVTFEVYEDDQYIYFSISDTGEGFSPEALKHAAEQFYMGDSSRNSKSHYGMGLFIADTAVKQHKGQLILENAADTHGAEVIFKIPL